MSTVQQRRTLGELREAVRRRVPVQANDTVLTYEVIDEFLNVALRQVSVEHNWPWLLDTQTVTTASGDGDYDVEVDYLATRTVSENSTDLVLRHKNLRDILEYSDSVTGRPTYYVVTAESMKLRPVPDGVYTLTHYFYRMEPRLAGDLAKPLIPFGYDEGVILYATHLCLLFRGETDRATATLNSYGKWLDRVADNSAESREPRAPRVRPGSAL